MQQNGKVKKKLYEFEVHSASVSNIINCYINQFRAHQNLVHRKGFVEAACVGEHKQKKLLTNLLKGIIRRLHAYCQTRVYGVYKALHTMG